MASTTASDRDAADGRVALRVLHARNIGVVGALGVATFGLVAAAILLAIGAAFDYPPSALLRDPPASLRFSPIVGIISHLGVFAMLATAAICLFVAPIAREGRLFLAIGIFSGYFMLDDFFMLHEHVLPKAGVPEIVALGFIALMAAAIFLLHWRIFFRHEATPLWIAGALLAASVGMDVLAPYSELQNAIENLLKFAGLLIWSAFWTVRAFFDLRDQFAKK